MLRSNLKTSISWHDYLQLRAQRSRQPQLANFFQQAILSAETPIAEVPLIALDIETTGLDSHRHDILSIGLVPFDWRRIALSERRYWVVKPASQLPAESVVFHRLTDTELANAQSFAELLPDLLEALAGRLPVVHFRNIERPFLDHAVTQVTGESLRFPLIDTMALEALRHRLPWWQRCKRWLGYAPTSIRLHDSRARYGLPLYQGHHALTDALATAELLQAQLAHHYSGNTPVSTLWC